MKNLIITLLTTTLVLMTSVVFSQGACEGETSYTYQGVTYDLIEIGNQCWFDAPIKSAVYANGSPIQNIGASNGANWSSTTEGAYAVNINDDYLYNWYAINLGVCPPGYNVPTDRDFAILEAELGVKRSEIKSFDYRGKGINFKAEWFEAGFAIDFAGVRVDNDGNLKEYQDGMYMWTLSEAENGNAIDRALFDYMPFVARHDNLWQTSDNKGHGMLAMCVKDDEQDALSIGEMFSRAFIMPGPTTVELQDFTNFNVGDTVYYDETFTEVPEVGSLFINQRGDSLVAYNGGVLVHVSDWPDLTGAYWGALSGPGYVDQTCGCINFNNMGECMVVWVIGSPRLDCATVCANAGHSYSFNPGDWNNCLGGEVAPTPTEDFKGYTFTSSRGTQYPVTKFTNEIFFDDLPIIRSAADFTSIRAYVDPARTIPYTYETQFAPSVRGSVQDHIVYWTDELTGVEHAFKVSGEDGFLIELDSIPTGAWPKTIACMCQSCCPGGGAGSGPATTDIPLQTSVPQLITFYSDPGSGNLNCSYGCPGVGLSSNGGPPGGCCGNYDFFDPLGPDLSTLQEYYVSYGDTTITNFDQFFTINVLDTIYTNPEKTIIPRVGTSFVNEYQEILYTDDRGVLRYAEFFGEDIVRDYYEDPNNTRGMWCCDLATGVGTYIIITNGFRRGCGHHCGNRGLACMGNCSFGFGSSAFLSDPENSDTKAYLIRSTAFEIDSYRSPGTIDFTSDLDGVYLKASYIGNAQDFNEIALTEDNHFSYLNDFVVKLNDVYYKFNNDLMLERSTLNGGLDIPVDWPNSGPFGDPYGNACSCSMPFGPYCTQQVVFGPTWRSCNFICNRAGGTWADCTNFYSAIDDEGYNTFHVSYGDSSRYYGDIGYTFNVFDTLYTDYDKTKPIPFGLAVRNAYGQLLYADSRGVLKYEDMFEEEIIRGFGTPQTQTCICCYTPPLGEPFSVTVTTEATKAGCSSVCVERGYEPFSWDGCDVFGGEVGPISMDQVSRIRYDNLTSDGHHLLFNTLVQGLNSSFTDVAFVFDERDVRGIVGQTLSFSFSDEVLRGTAQKTDPNNYEFMKGMIFKVSGEPYWFRVNNSFVIEGGGLDPLPEWGAGDRPRYLNMCMCWSDAPDCIQTLAWSTRLRRPCETICAPSNTYNPCND